MSDLIRGFRDQLTTSMDSVLRRAVFEIMMIFENSLHEHQMELVHKGEEVAQLKMKLQRAEVRLTEIECGGSRGAEVKKGGTEDVVNAPEPTDDVPEIHFEVPDDWCAPLGCETVTKQEYLCPSVRLRQLSIRLSPISIKQEMDWRDIDSNQRKKGLWRSGKGSLRNEKTMQDSTIPIHGQGTLCPPLTTDMKKLLQGIKRVHTKTTISTKSLSLKSRRQNVKEKKNTKKIIAKEMEKNGDEKQYSCRFCKKDFDTLFGRNVHTRSHKRCKGCKDEFPSPSALNLHKPSCIKLKKFFAKKVRATNLPKPESLGEENKRKALGKKQVPIKKECTASSSKPIESSTQKNGGNTNLTCVHCNKTCSTRWNLEEHLTVHSRKNSFCCSMCPKTFYRRQSLRKHKKKMHRSPIRSRVTNENSAWTMPLENTDDICEDLNSPRKEKNQANNHTDVQTDNTPDTGPSSIWKTMGTRCPEGFICRLCPKSCKDIYRLIEHFRTHTGENPIQCNNCSKTFRFHSLLSAHRKNCLEKKKIAQCAQCKKTFCSNKWYNRHVLNCQRGMTYSCEVCGKGFSLRGYLKNHMERLHKDASL